MRYVGGKSKCAAEIAAVINRVRRVRSFWDPFGGGLSMSYALGGPGIISDIHPSLIAMYQAIARGWVPPSSVSQDEWERAKTLPDDDPFKAFAGFACSFGAKWFRGYARGPRSTARVVTDRNWAGESARNLLKIVPALVRRGCTFERIDFLDVEPPRVDFSGVLYLDPPYRNVQTSYGFEFDFDRFDARAKQWARITDVFVSEYALPYGEEVWRSRAMSHGLGGATRVERLYRVCS